MAWTTAICAAACAQLVLADCRICTWQTGCKNQSSSWPRAKYLRLPTLVENISHQPPGCFQSVAKEGVELWVDISLLWDVGTSNKKTLERRLARWVKVFVAKPDSLCWILGQTYHGTHISMEGEARFHREGSEDSVLCVCSLIFTYHTHNDNILVVPASLEAEAGG